MTDSPKIAAFSLKPRKAVAELTPYTPGEQPKRRMIKLNTNENPYPPSPRVTEALAKLSPESIRKYPDPVGEALLQALSVDHRVPPRQTILTNGSDEILRLAAEAYVEPGEKVGYLWPTYSLYPLFVEKAGGVEVRIPWMDRTPEEALLDAPKDLKVLYIANPNPPIGKVVGLDTLRQVAQARPETLVVVDEAYIFFGGDTAMEIVAEGTTPNLMVTRTYSKSHSLAGLRVGFGSCSPEVADVLYRIKDSYNVSAAGQAAALAVREDQAYTRNTVHCIRATRKRLTHDLRVMGFEVEDSQGNFVFAKCRDAKGLFQYLREKDILVRYFETPELHDGLRITIGTDKEIDALIEALRDRLRP
ncbi:MAG: histidinol-phosphate transaminase [Sumerlaeia bacterium]